MLIKTRGICLQTSKYAESSVIAQVLTEEKGLQSYIISGVRSAKPRVHASLLQPLSVLDMVVYWRSDPGLFRTRELKAHLMPLRTPFELPRTAVAVFVAEVLSKALRQSESPPELFEFVVEFAEHLDQAERGVALLPTYFLLRLTQYLGFPPEFPAFGAPYFFDAVQGYFLPEPPDHPRHGDADVSQLLVDMASRPLGSLHEVRSQRTTRTQATLLLLDYIKGQLGNFGQVQSHRVYAEVLQG